MSRYEKLLFQLIIFLIPTNLALHWILPESYVHGVLVDYLIPKLYLSDLPILALLFLWLQKSFISSPSRRDLEGDQNTSNRIYKSTSVVILSLLFTIFINTLLSPSPFAGTWYFFKIAEFSLFFLWIKAHNSSMKMIEQPLLISMLFQSFIGLYQFFTQRSLAGYWFLGETMLNLTANITKIDLSEMPFTQGLGLAITPYGTTPHSNILGGFLVIGGVITYLASRSKKTWTLYQKTLYVVTYTASLITLLATASVSAWISLVISITVIGLWLTSGKKNARLLILTLLSLGAVIISKNQFFVRHMTDEYSTSRRIELHRIAIHMLKEHPLMGIGLNQFTKVLPDYGTITAYTSFLQPVHNIFLLWLTETGLVGITIITSILIACFKKYPIVLLRPSLIPCIAVLVIGMFDHYPITLQTGQLLIIFSLTFLMNAAAQPTSKT